MGIEEIKKFENAHGFYSWLFCRISTYFIYLLDRIGIQTSPNKITLLTLLFGFIFGIALLTNNQWIAAATLNLAYFCDNLDGIYARYKRKTSIFGAIFDPFIDRINSIIYYFALGIFGYVYFDSVIFVLIPGIIFALSHIPHEFKYYFEKYKIENVKLEKKEMSLIKRIIFEIFAGDKFFLILGILLLVGLTENLLLGLFAYELIKRLLWAFKTVYMVIKSRNSKAEVNK